MEKLLTVSFIVLMSCPLWGQTQPASAQPQISPPSLGQLARNLRAQEKKENLKNVKTFTNDNIPRDDAGLSVLGPAAPAAESAASGPSAGEAAPAGSHGREYFRLRMARLQQRLETDQRELSVLQQRLAQSNMQYYPNPTQTLMQEYSRSNINKLTSQIDDKKQQISQDEQAIQDLRMQLAREGGEPGWVEAGNRGWATDIEAARQAQLQTNSKAPLGEQLHAANQALASAKEQARLAENELSLLQLQQARELNPGVQADVASKIDAKQTEIAAAKSAIEQARKRVDEIQREIEKQQEQRGQASEH